MLYVVLIGAMAQSPNSYDEFRLSPLEVPSETTKIVANYNSFLEETEIPWLYLYAPPRALNTPEGANYWSERAKNIETVYIGTSARGLQYPQSTDNDRGNRRVWPFIREIDNPPDGG